MTMSVDNQVAVFIDYENIVLSFREKLGRDAEIDWSQVLETAVDYGRVVIRRAYADWSTYSASQRELLRLGIDLIHVASKRGKNASDIKIVIDALEMLMREHANVSHVLLVSGDGDFTELVHRLRAHGKVMIGLGVSGASAEYLINACDQFIFYDLIADATQQAVLEGEVIEATAPTFEVSEARQLLRRVLQTREGEWISGGELKGAMLRLNPAFNERNYGYETFKGFLSAQGDLVRLRTAQPGAHLEIQLISEADTPLTAQAPEVLLDRYLSYLAQQKIRVTPTEHRPAVIFKFYEIYQSNPECSLTELKEKLHGYFEENAPSLKWQYVHETVHQLFHTFCFEFDRDDSKYPEGVRLWDRVVRLDKGVESADDLLARCDQGLLQRLARRLGSVDEIDLEVVARLLYGSVQGEKMLDHIRQLLEEV